MTDQTASSAELAKLLREAWESYSAEEDEYRNSFEQMADYLISKGVSAPSRSGVGAGDVEAAAKAMYYVGNTHGWDEESDSCRWEYLQLARAAIAAQPQNEGETK